MEPLYLQSADVFSGLSHSVESFSGYDLNTFTSVLLHMVTTQHGLSVNDTVNFRVTSRISNNRPRALYQTTQLQVNLKCSYMKYVNRLASWRMRTYQPSSNSCCPLFTLSQAPVLLKSGCVFLLHMMLLLTCKPFVVIYQHNM